MSARLARIALRRQAHAAACFRGPCPPALGSTRHLSGGGEGHAGSSPSSSSSSGGSSGGKKGLFHSFFETLRNAGVGQQFQLDNEHVIWGGPVTSREDLAVAAVGKVPPEEGSPASPDSAPVSSRTPRSRHPAASGDKGEHSPAAGAGAGAGAGAAGTGLIDHWQVYSDAEYGGSSWCRVTIEDSAPVEEVDDDDEAAAHAGPSGQMLLTFDGRVDFGPQSPIRHTAKGGYCALMGRCDGSVELMDHEGVEVLLRTAHGPASLLFSLKPYSMMSDDLYQVILQTSSSAWKRFHLPFHMFT